MTDHEVQQAVRELLNDWNALPKEIREAAQAEAKRRADDAEAFTLRVRSLPRAR